MRKVRGIPNKWEVQEEYEKETKNKQMCSTGEKGISRHWLGDLKGNPSSGPFSSRKVGLMSNTGLSSLPRPHQVDLEHHVKPRSVTRSGTTADSNIIPSSVCSCTCYFLCSAKKVCTVKSTVSFSPIILLQVEKEDFIRGLRYLR